MNIIKGFFGFIWKIISICCKFVWGVVKFVLKLFLKPVGCIVSLVVIGAIVGLLIWLL